MRNVRMGMKIQAPLIQSHIDADTIQIVIRFTNIIPTRVSSPLDRDEKWWAARIIFRREASLDIFSFAFGKLAMFTRRFSDKFNFSIQRIFTGRILTYP
jgi:hypothetical protein